MGDGYSSGAAEIEIFYIEVFYIYYVKLEFVLVIIFFQPFLRGDCLFYLAV